MSTKAKWRGPCTYGIEMRREGLVGAGWTEAVDLGCQEVKRLFAEVAVLIYRDHSLKEVSNALAMDFTTCRNEIAAAGVAIRKVGTGNVRSGGSCRGAKQKALAALQLVEDGSKKQQALTAYVHGGKTMKEAARSVGVDTCTMSNWIKGDKRRPDRIKKTVLFSREAVSTRIQLLHTCPVTKGNSTTMSHGSFASHCLRAMFLDHNRKGYCGECRGKIKPPELSFW